MIWQPVTESTRSELIEGESYLFWSEPAETPSGRFTDAFSVVNKWNDSKWWMGYGQGKYCCLSTPEESPFDLQPGKIQFTPMPEMATLRDQFAMAALTGLLADPQVQAHDSTATLTYKIADWMLEARK